MTIAKPTAASAAEIAMEKITIITPVAGRGGGAKRQNAIILSLDKGDFWNDNKFPLREAPAVILIASREQSVDVYIDALNLFLFGMDMVGRIRQIPGFFNRSKSKISMNGFSHKFISVEGNGYSHIKW